MYVAIVFCKKDRESKPVYLVCVWVAIEERKTKRFVFPTPTDKDVG